MTIQKLKKVLSEKGYSVCEENKVLHGKKLKLTNGATITYFDKGKIQVQGKPTIKSEMESVIGLSNLKAGGKNTGNPKEVFVVYGHDDAAKTQLEAMLRRWGLKPLILNQLPSEGQTIIEKLESYTERGEFGIVLATPDDEGFEKGQSNKKAFRARQNVVLEMGMLLSKLKRDRVVILLKNSNEMEKPSDIQGLIYIEFKENVEDAKVDLAKEMNAKGYTINLAEL